MFSLRAELCRSEPLGLSGVNYWSLSTSPTHQLTTSAGNSMDAASTAIWAEHSNTARSRRGVMCRSSNVWSCFILPTWSHPVHSLIHLINEIHMRNIPHHQIVTTLTQMSCVTLKADVHSWWFRKYKKCSTCLSAACSHTAGLSFQITPKKNKTSWGTFMWASRCCDHTLGVGRGLPHVVQDSQESPLLYFLTNLNTQDRINILELLCLPDSSFHEKTHKICMITQAWLGSPARRVLQLPT